MIYLQAYTSLCDQEKTDVIKTTALNCMVKLSKAVYIPVPGSG